LRDREALAYLLEALSARVAELEEHIEATAWAHGLAAIEPDRLDFLEGVEEKLRITEAIARDLKIKLDRYERGFDG
jgi:hypothetical protein